MFKKISEAVGILFLFSGPLTSSYFFRGVHSFIDLRLLFGVSTLLAISRYLFQRPKINLTLQGQRFLMFYSFFYCFCLLSFLLNFDGNSSALLKAIQFFIFTPIFVATALIIFNSDEAFNRLWRIVFLVCILFVIGKFIDIFGGQINTVGAIEGYQWLTMISFFGIIVCLRMMECADKFSMQVLIILAIFLFIGGSLWGGARQNFMALLLVFGFLFVKKYSHSISIKSINKTLFLLSIMAAISIGVLLGLQSLDIKIIDVRGYQRVFTFFQYMISLDIIDAAANSGRWALFRNGMDVFGQNVLMGVGFGNFHRFAYADNYSHPHNFFIEILSEMGLIGAIFLIPLMIAFAMKVYRVRSKDLNELYIVAITIGIFVTMMVSGDLGTNRIFWFFFTIMWFRSQSPMKIKG